MEKEKLIEELEDSLYDSIILMEAAFSAYNYEKVYEHSKKYVETKMILSNLERIK